MFLRHFFERLIMLFMMGVNMVFGTQFMMQEKAIAATFVDVPINHWAFVYVESLYEAGITKGCQEEPEMLYCPQNDVTRAEMAIFLLRSMDVTKADLEPATGRVFNDVKINHFAAPWIEKLEADGYTKGCQTIPPLFCPDKASTRAEAAIFLLRVKYRDPSYVPDALKPGESTGFSDVSYDDFAAPWIKQLAAEGITDGCGDGRFCPNDPVTRDQMAVFLVRTFDLPLAEPPDVEVLPNFTHYIDPTNYFHVVGEVVNLSESSMSSVDIEINFFNDNDQLLATFDETTLLSTIQAGDKACFDFAIQEPIGWDYYEFETINKWEQGQDLPMLTVNNLSHSHNSEELWYEIMGDVTNQQGSLVSNVRPVGTLYNEEGNVVGCEWTYTDPEDLAPGAVGSFQMPLLGRDFGNVVEFRMQVEGQE